MDLPREHEPALVAHENREAGVDPIGFSQFQTISLEEDKSPVPSLTLS